VVALIINSKPNSLGDITVILLPLDCKITPLASIPHKNTGTGIAPLDCRIYEIRPKFWAPIMPLLSNIKFVDRQLLDKIASALSVTPTCPQCNGVIPSEDINVANDIAFCRHCDLSHRLSDLTSSATDDEGATIIGDVDASKPPAGTWVRRNGAGTVIGASHRSIGQAVALSFFCLFWNGLVSVFVLLALASTLKGFGLSIPHWLPTPNKNGNSMPLGMALFLWLFLLPFIAVGLAMVGAFFSSLAGRTELQIQGNQCTLFSGIGSLGRRRRFSTSEVKDVRIEDKRWVDNDGDSRRSTQLVIETNEKPIKFGSMLTNERRQFIAGCIKKELVRHKPIRYGVPASAGQASRIASASPPDPRTPNGGNSSPSN
jgi:hypothetical protein